MQGFNMGRYIPPDAAGLTSANRLHNKHPLGSRGAKSHLGILTVRFEMPFPIWCTTCPKPTIIGQGVRFNAEKKKVGAYYSTPVFSFRMKHIPCGGTIEIRTDPKNTAYVVTEGARKRDLGEEKVLEGDVRILTEEEREQRRSNAFASLEGKIDDKRRLDGARDRLEELQSARNEQWSDPYALNQRMRKTFRVGRKAREKEAQLTSKLQDKMSLSVDLPLLPPNEDDVRRAALVDFGPLTNSATQALSKPLFAAAPEPPTKETKNHKISRKLKAEQHLERHRRALVAEIRGNTRVKIDPFLHPTGSGGKVVLGVKRKRGGRGERAKADGDAVVLGGKEALVGREDCSAEGQQSSKAALVDYDSE